MRPFLKWLGNKHRLLHHIQKNMGDGHCLIEPFAGSGAVFLGTQYSQYILSDLNKDLINLYRLVANEGIDFINYCKSFYIEKNNCAEMYYHFRERFNISTDIREKSALFLYLNRHGYNGLCRYNLSGGYNVPFGRYVNPYFPEKELLFFCEKSKCAEFHIDDFATTMNKAQPGDVVYCDPPYVPLTQSASFTAYTKQAFNEKSQLKLAQKAEELAGRGVCVIISNHDTKGSREYYKNAKAIRSFPVRRVISCKGNKRKPVKELLAIY